MSNLIPGVEAIKAGKKAAKKLPKKKKMRQPTAKELKEGRAGKTKWQGRQRYLTKGNKPGEMVYSAPNTSIYDEEVYGSIGGNTGRYVMSGPNKGTRRVTQVKSDVTGGRGNTNPPRVKQTASKGQIHSAANKDRIDKAARAANKRSAAANRDTIKKNETIGQQRKRKKENQDIDKGIKTIALNGGGSVEDALKGKNKIPTIKPKSGPFKVRPPGYKPPVVKKPTNSKSEFEGYMEKTQPKKYGGKINYRMGGGQVVDSSYGN